MFSVSSSALVLLLLVLLLAAVAVDARRRRPSPQLQTFSKESLRTHEVPSVRAPYVFDPAAHRVTNLPGMPAANASMPQYAGYVNVDKINDGNLFYWFFPHPEPTRPLIIWMNGGPGCSSVFDGLFLEIGPFKIDPDLNLRMNKYSWREEANLLIVDQPVGTGLSYVKNKAGYCKDETQVDEEFYSFLATWFNSYPDYRSRELFLAGESYAGTYIPHMATIIMQRNLISHFPSFNLKGVAIGNGWTNPAIQTGAYIPSAFGVGLIDENQRASLWALYQYCKPGLLAGTYTIPDCANIFNFIADSSGTFRDGQVNVYDVRLYDHDGGASWPTGNQYTKRYLNRPSVRAALHTLNASVQRNWTECDETVNAYLAHEDLLDSSHLLPGLLDTYGLRVLLYSGQFDLICGQVGTQQMLAALKWSGAEEYAKVQSAIWAVNERTAGYVTSAKKLTFLRNLGSSHMVPYDTPAQSLDMISRFLGDMSFNVDGKANIPLSYTTPMDGSGGEGVKPWIVAVVSIGCGIVSAAIAVAYMRKSSTNHGHVLLPSNVPTL